jgi:hypothetical protein
MPDPASITGASLAAGAITITGSILGVHYDALLLGFAGGIVVLSFLPKMTIRGVFTSLFTSSILGGVLAPVADSTIKHMFNYLDTAGDSLRMASALLIGVGAQTAIPLFIKWIEKRGSNA